MSALMTDPLFAWAAQVSERRLVEGRQLEVSV